VKALLKSRESSNNNNCPLERKPVLNRNAQNRIMSKTFRTGFVRFNVSQFPFTTNLKNPKMGFAGLHCDVMLCLHNAILLGNNFLEPFEAKSKKEVLSNDLFFWFVLVLWTFLLVVVEFYECSLAFAFENYELNSLRYFGEYHECSQALKNDIFCSF